MSNTFAQVNNAAHTGALGNNRLPMPSNAQLDAGNYAKGHVRINGLDVAIENPAYTYRKSTDKTGQQWSCLMQAHYGYINGYKGNDGDNVDVFVGNVPENDTAYIINQKTQGGFFDEHKVMLGFLSQQQAVDTYQHCFERGWTGLMSVVPCTMSQLKWWLANGDKARPVTKERLPYAGLERLDSVVWGGTDDANLYSHGGQLSKLLYQIRLDDTNNQALEPLAYHDMIAELGNQGFMYQNYDALIVEYNKLERKAKQLLMVMQSAADTVKPVGVTVSKPLTKNGVSNVIAWFEMDDGQAVGVFFHNPDKNPKKLDPTDEMISYKWVLNKKDITIAVAPENGKDVIIRTVAKRIMLLVEKNHDRFMKANSDKAELNQKEQDLTAQVAEKQAVLKGLQDEVAALQVRKVQVEAERLAQEEAAIQTPPLEVVTEEDAPVDENEDELKRIASLYSAEWGWPLGNKRSLEFASAVLAKDAYALEFMANGFNDKSKKVFSEVTGVSLPKQQGATWKAIRDWAGISDEQENYRVAVRDVAYEVKAFMRENNVSQEMVDKNKALIASKIAEGFDNVEKIGSNYWFTNKEGQGINLSEKPKKGYLGLSKSRALVEAMIIENKAKLALFAPTIVSTSQPESTTQERPSNWRTNLANARAVAKSLGIETKGKKLERLVKDIDIFDDNEVKKELLAEFKGLASRLVLPKGYIFDLSDAEKSIGDITRSTAAWIRKQGKIDTNTIRVELRTIPDSSQGIIFNSVHIYADDPKTKKEFDKFNYQNFDSIGRSEAITPKAIVAKMEDFLTKAILPEIEYQKVKNSTTLDTVDLPSLGVAIIESIGNENIYIEKDGKYYISKVGNPQLYALGEWDFAKYPEGKLAAPVTQPVIEPPTVANGKIYDYLKEMGKPDSKVEFDDDYMVLVAIATRDINNPMEDLIDDEYDLEKISKRLTPHKEPLFKEAMTNFNKRVIAGKVAAEPPTPNPDRDYLQSIIDGEVDLEVKGITAKIRQIMATAKDANDSDMLGLADKAAKAYAAHVKAKAAAKLAEVQ